MINRAFILIGILVCLTVAEEVSAQEIEGDFRLSVGVPLLLFQDITTEIDETNQEINSSKLALGTVESGGVGFAYGVNPFITLGCDIGLTYTEDKVEESETTDMSFSIVPTIEFLLLTTGNIRPFVDLGLGVAFVDSGSDEMDSSGTELVIGLGIGLRGFVFDYFSIDPALWFSYHIGSIEIESGNRTIDADASGFSLGLGIELSGWM